MAPIPFMENLPPGDSPARVRVYRNLNKRGPNGEPVYSVVDTSTGRVVAHVLSALLADASFHVAPAGRDRVRRERAKNVHAGIVGRPCLDSGQALPGRAHYDPYTTDTFVDLNSRQPLSRAALARVGSDGISYLPQ